MKKIQFDVRNLACRSAVSVSIAAGLALSLSACGDDVTEINNNSAIAVLKSGEKLSKQSCDSTNVGEMLFVMDSVTTFVCDGKSWQTMKGETGSDGTSCKAKSVKNKAKTLEGVEVSCDGAVMDTIWNGVDGAKGDSGAVGAACTAAALGATADHQNGGVKITCGENSYDLWNGDDGESAYELSGSELSEEEWIESLNGAKGDGCTLDDDGKGSVTVTCGDAEPVVLFKAVCGGEPYEPAKKFCADGKTYDLCGGKVYNLKTQICDTRDNQLYKFVTIGEGEKAQVWMAENLNYSVNPGIQSWCGGGESNTTNEGDCSVYGRLYTWAAAVGKTEDECGCKHECSLTLPVQGVCPSGWHLPSYQEFETLINVANPEFGTGTGSRYLKFAGVKFMSKEGWESSKGVPLEGSDTYGFSALPTGYKHTSTFQDVGVRSGFWSSTRYDENEAYRMEFASYETNAAMIYFHKDFGFGVRCLKD